MKSTNLNKLDTLVLNADSMPLAIIRWQRAICLVIEEKVIQLDFYKDVKIHDGKGRAYPVPAVILIKKHIKRDYNAVPFSRKNILIRDCWQCMYCGRYFQPRDLTIDHVFPISKWKREGRAGSPTRWDNIVTSCYKCNQRKGDKTCEEAMMYPIVFPSKPKYAKIFLGLHHFNKNVPNEWRKYINYIL